MGNKLGDVESAELDFYLGGVLMEDAKREWVKTLRERQRGASY
jgi:hypothetical protein